MIADLSTLFRRRFTWLLLAAAVPLLAVIVLLGQREMAEVRSDILCGYSDAADLRRIGLERLAAEVDTHITVMRAFAEQRLAQQDALPANDGALDWPPLSANPGPDRGVILGNPAIQTDPVRREITVLMPLFALAPAAHEGRPWLRW